MYFHVIHNSAGHKQTNDRQRRFWGKRMVKAAETEMLQEVWNKSFQVTLKTCRGCQLLAFYQLLACPSF